MGWLDRIAECNRHNLSGFLPFEVGETRIGWVRRSLAKRLADRPEVFAVGAERVGFAPALDTPEQRTAGLAEIVREWHRSGLLRRVSGELLAVGLGIGEAPLFLIDRSAVQAFGFSAVGVHVNGYVRRPDGLHVWIAERAAGRHSYPGMLDNVVAGGQPAGLSLLENVVKEAAEEAGIPCALAGTARPAGAVTYCLETDAGLRPDILYVYDLELPAGFQPRNVDGEVAHFELWPAARLAETVRETRRFKFNCNLVIIDFLIRCGVLGPDDPDYAAILAGLRPPLPIDPWRMW